MFWFVSKILPHGKPFQTPHFTSCRFASPSSSGPPPPPSLSPPQPPPSRSRARPSSSSSALRSSRKSPGSSPHLSPHLLDLGQGHHPHLLPFAHHANLQVLPPTLHNLQKCHDGQFHCGRLGVNLVRSIALLQELPHSLGVAADGVGFPLVVGPTGVGLVEPGGLVVVEACDETRYAKRSSAIGLGVPLLQAGNMPGDVLQGDRVLHSELVGLTLHPRLLDQHTCVCR